MITMKKTKAILRLSTLFSFPLHHQQSCSKETAKIIKAPNINKCDVFDNLRNDRTKEKDVVSETFIYVPNTNIEK